MYVFKLLHCQVTRILVSARAGLCRIICRTAINRAVEVSVRPTITTNPVTKEDPEIHQEKAK